MPTVVLGTLDRLLVAVLVAGARRRWPVLSLVPSRWLRPLLLPTARQARSSLGRGAMLISLALIAAITLPTVFG